MNLTKWSPLELAAIEALAARAGDDGDIIREQMAAADVSSRVNTGAGFYTHIDVLGSPRHLTENVYSGCSASVDGLDYPLIFLLWVKGGGIASLEGAATDDDTASFDFWRANFKVM